jgi:hypothetical protein
MLVSEEGARYGLHIVRIGHPDGTWPEILNIRTFPGPSRSQFDAMVLERWHSGGLPDPFAL